MRTSRSGEKLDIALADSLQAAILACLAGGRAYLASELARAVKISTEEASTRLGQMKASGIVVSEASGRFEYYRVADANILRALNESKLSVPHRTVKPRSQTQESQALLLSRTCYNHLAGRLGVLFADKLLERGFIEEAGQAFVVTPNGMTFFEDFGIDVAELRSRYPDGLRFAKACLDFSERRHHLGGAFGRAITQRLFDLGWIERIADTRSVRLTQEGCRGFAQQFGILLPASDVDL